MAGATLAHATCVQSLSLVIDNHSSDAVNAQTQEIRFSSGDSMWLRGDIQECVVFERNEKNEPLPENVPRKIKSVAMPCHVLYRCIGHLRYLPNETQVTMAVPRETYASTVSHARQTSSSSSSSSVNQVIVSIKPAEMKRDESGVFGASTDDARLEDNWFEVRFLIGYRNMSADQISSKNRDLENRNALIAELIPSAGSTNMFGVGVAMPDTSTTRHAADATQSSNASSIESTDDEDIRVSF